jgi:hemoglobin
LISSGKLPTHGNGRGGVAGHLGARVSGYSEGQNANETQNPDATVMNAIAPAFGCATRGMPFADSLKRVLGLVPAPLAFESIPLIFCAGRVLVESFEAGLNLPGFAQPATDDYAVRYAGVISSTAVPVAGRTAGEASGHLAFDGAHRMLTGASLQCAADSVIARENVHRDGDLLVQSFYALVQSFYALVQSFYATARQDEVIGHLFDDVADWERHIAKITAFWSSVSLLTGRYHGQPFAARFPLPLERSHFAGWLVPLGETAGQVCTSEGADYLMEKAHRIAGSLEMVVAVSRGQLPSRIGARS